MCYSNNIPFELVALLSYLYYYNTCIDTDNRISVLWSPLCMTEGLLKDDVDLQTCKSVQSCISIYMCILRLHSLQCYNVFCAHMRIIKRFYTIRGIFFLLIHDGNQPTPREEKKTLSDR